MSDSNRLDNLVTSLGMEILTARSGSQEGQFPILDLLGNLRDEAGKIPELAEMHSVCQKAWERMVGIVESAQSFTAAEIQGLKELLTRLQALAKPGTTSRSPAALMHSFETGAVEEKETLLVLNLSSDSDLLREFAAESREHLDNIEKGILVLENNPADGETLDIVFRAFHTFKGGAGFLNLVPINQLAHVLESLLDLARQHKLTIDERVIDLILRGRDTLKRFLDEIDGQLNGSRPVQPVEIPVTELKDEVQARIEKLRSDAKITPLPLSSAAKAPSLEIAAAAHSEHSAVVKVETGKLDALLDLVGELVISQSLVAGDLTGVAKAYPQAVRNMAQLSRITKELQRISMSMRMVPIRGAFQKMARVARDIGVRLNKKVHLLTEGEDTELDRNVVEQLNDPLLHMIRNSMDHGIEAPEVRLASGKPAIGTIRLRANHQGGNIVIEINDDGAGLDRERILAKAIERGLAKPGVKMDDEDVFAFIFAAGFSTAEKLTDISGRGVGMDVVKKNIEQLRGSVEISSIRGQGAQFKITLPLTLAIIDGLVVKVGEEQYIVPTGAILESFRPAAGMITSIHGRGEVVNVRGRLIPLLRLSEHFGIPAVSNDPTKCIGVVVQAGANMRCLLVDALVTKQEVVIKNLSELIAHKNRFFAGAAILGDGRVALILDVNSLVYLELQDRSKAA